MLPSKASICTGRAIGPTAFVKGAWWALLEARMAAPWFMFATGIENSYPTIKNGSVRVDEMEKCGHYKHWRRDFELLQELDIRYLRYGPPIHRVWLGQVGMIGASRTRPSACSRRSTSSRSSISAISGCRTGSATSRIPIFRRCSRTMRSAFAQRFPWVQLYTPVNEMFICATFSAAYGWWNEQLAQRHGLRDGAQAHREGECAGDGRHSRGPPGCDLHSERVVGILPCRRARRDRAAPRS